MIDQKDNIYGSNIAFLSSYLSRVFSVKRYSSILPAAVNTMSEYDVIGYSWFKLVHELSLIK